jgi:hypothetical protein
VLLTIKKLHTGLRSLGVSIELEYLKLDLVITFNRSVVLKRANSSLIKLKLLKNKSLYLANKGNN